MARGNNMPSIAQETTTSSPSSVSCKKRRRDDDRDNSQQFTLYASLLANSTAAATNNAVYSSHSSSIYPDSNHHSHHHHHHGSNLLPLATTARKMIPLPLSKRQRMTTADTVEVGNDQHDGAPKRQQQQHQDLAPHSKSPTHHQREGDSPSKQQQQQRSELGTRSSTTSTSLLSPCHICCRKPSKKSDLDSFADCQGCGQRTCYVCIRECLGWSPNSQQPQQQQPPPPPSLQTEPSFTMIDVDSEEPATGDRPAETGPEDSGWAKGGGGHRKMVCSRCCVEKGQDGDVVCLGCLPFVEG
ncbi:hypothetical protein QBC40DRAFT_44878 [Triangularia verruculosa]|uniref:Uncharacterized protein n=1 Tax=Triangularia verruculosa TaxID=2587418 RepID=A0AAN7AV29_9PEZI|nr:hypothetical protein QBC40DRAFT_44878 [Triangularia verruculosa]